MTTTLRRSRSDTQRVQLRIRGGTDFNRALERDTGSRKLRPGSISTFQINIGLVCNLACHHCHVESSPRRTEAMDWQTLALVLQHAQAAGAGTIDITGGAPEMNAHFRRFVAEARALGFRVMVRTNLTIMLHAGYEDLPAFYREHGVHLVASLPCYLENNVDKQRGRGVYHDSIEVIRRLNAVGYGIEAKLPLDLVFNPGGAKLPPPESKLQPDYQRELDTRFGIRFTRLICITNMPIGRFLHDLARDGEDEAYLQLLRESFNPGTVEGLMCRHQVHVGHDGRLYDCDFNYAIALPAASVGHIRDFDAAAWLARPIATGDHCFGCTAGAGSSCGGTLVK